jgi:hypothetical protein
MEDIFDYAKKCVDNKGVAARIGHSAKLHSVRSAVSSKGSFGSKAGNLVGSAIRATFQAIPLPAVGSLLASVEEAVEKAIKGGLHHRSLSQATTTTDKVKFQLKELNVEEMDRYRWKVSESVTELNKVMVAFNTNLAKKKTEHATCDAFLEAAMAGEQASRRIERLKKLCLAMHAAMFLTMSWLEECENGQPLPPSQAFAAAPGRHSSAPDSVNGFKNKLADILCTHIDDEDDSLDDMASDAEREAYIADAHGKCDRWCYFREAGKVDNWTTAKNRAAWVVRNLAQPFGPDSFNNNLGSLW